MLKICAALGALLLWSTPYNAFGGDENALLMVKERSPTDWAYFRPYVPEKQEYNLELGSMWEQNTLYWLAGGYGHHLGRCVFSESQTCQQYLDTTIGFGGRSSKTLAVGLIGPRWQWVNLPSALAPFAQIFVGAIDINDDFRDDVYFTYGLSYGLTTSVHERIDLKILMRAGMAERFWGQGTLVLSLKMDKWVKHFAKKIKSLGKDAMEATISAPGKMLDMISNPKEEEKKK